MRLKLTTLAESDLLEIGRYIAGDNVERALSFIDELEMACGTLLENPLRFPVIRRRREYEIRKRVHGNYIILYVVKQAEVVVVRVVNGATDYERWLDDNGGPVA